MLESSKASVAVANLDFVEFLNEAVGSLVSSELKWSGTPEQLDLLPEADVVFSPIHQMKPPICNLLPAALVCQEGWSLPSEL